MKPEREDKSSKYSKAYAQSQYHLKQNTLQNSTINNRSRELNPYSNFGL